MNTLRKGPQISPAAASWIEVDDEQAGQRIDNFLLRTLKGVPKSHVYQLLRTGQVRVNSGRIDATYRLAFGDRVRLPPVRFQPSRSAASNSLPIEPKLGGHTLLEDAALLVIDKPAGTAVHGGSGISRGVIEQLRAERPELRYLELVHRLDRETSGVLLLAKKRSALTGLHEQLRAGEMRKSYLVLVKGQWHNDKQHVRLPLNKYLTAEGERRVNVTDDGIESHTIFYRERGYGEYTLLRAELMTGRTHQIRVHLSHLGFPIAGDDKYGDFALNKELQRSGLKRMFLHAARVEFRHPLTGEPVVIEAPLPAALKDFLASLPSHSGALRV